MSKIRFEKGAAPATPAAGKVEVYADSADGHVKQKDDAGLVIDLTAGAASSSFQFSAGAGLSVNHTGGTVRTVGSAGFVFVSLAPGNLAGLTDAALNYVQMSTSGALFASTAAFFTSSVPMAEVTCSGGVVTNVVNRWNPAGTWNNLYHRPDSAFPQQIWGINNATTTGYLDMEGGDLQLQSLGGAGSGRAVKIGGAAGATSTLQVPDGVAATPRLCFIGDITTGIIRVGSAFGISAGGVERARFDAPAAGESSMWLQRNNGTTTTFVRVTLGAVDSGGVGFRLLRVPN